MLSRTAAAAAAALASRAATGARALASLPAVATDDSPFLRFASPAPANVDLTPALAGLPETKVTTLPNGLRVASEALPHAETATVGVWIDAGSRYESAATNGAAHFLEHMAFKGTTSRDARALEQEVEDMGGHLNAYTSREQTAYYARVPSGDKVGAAVDILADILQRSRLDAAAVERERDVILREAQEVEGVPEEVVFDHLHATAFQRTPLGRTILGPAANIRSLTRDDLAAYIKSNYVAPRMVVAAAGAVDHGALVELAKKAFAGLPTGGAATADLVKAAPAHFTGSEVRVRDPDMDKVHFAVAFKGASWGDRDAVPLMVAQSMLGAWDAASGAGDAASPLLAQRAAANGFADSYMAFNTNYADTGLFGVYATANAAGKVDDLAWAIMQDVASLSYTVDPAALARGKAALKASLLYAADGPAGVAEEIGRQLLVYGRRVPLAEMFARIDAVTPGAVQAAAQRFICDNDVAIAALGDTQNLPDYTYFRRRTYMLRY